MAKPASELIRQFLTWAVLLFLGLVIALPILPTGGPRPSQHAQCVNNIRNIAIALNNYHSTFGTLPPAYIADANGRPMHSWRVLILPYLDRVDLYARYRFDEPWNGPNNSKLHDVIVDPFCCPEDHGRGKSTSTSYAAIVGPETIWPAPDSMKFDDVTDGLADTLLVVEVANSGIHWMEPRDLDASSMPRKINDTSGKGISSRHPGLAVVAYASGHVRRLDERTPATTVEAMMTVRGGEAIPEHDR